jgi:hypothetical protein
VTFQNARHVQFTGYDFASITMLVHDEVVGLQDPEQASTR